MEVRALAPNDRAILSTFSCRDFRQPWTDLIQEMVRVHLADALEDGGVDALGLWVDGQLAGLVAWRVEPAGPSGTSICRSIVLAVQNGHVRRGYGRRLKEDMIERAREDGAAAVVSIVHWDNNAMISLNVVLGANVERIDGDPDHCNCVIAL